MRLRLAPCLALCLTGCIPPKTEFVVVHDTGRGDTVADDTGAPATDDTDQTDDTDDTSGDCVDGIAQYADRDGDGFGDPADVSYDCDTTGRVPDATDCDDTSAQAHPGGTEACDALDNDCSGAVDEGGVCPCEVVFDHDHPYLFCTDTKTWSDAEDTCESYGYHLAATGDAAENLFLYDTGHARSSASWWIGLNDIAQEGDYAWTTGEAVVYTNWWPGEPNNGSGIEDCAALDNVGYHEQWNDADCALHLSYVCEAP